MAAGSFTLYGAAIEGIARGLVDLDGHSFRAALCTSGYSPDIENHAALTDIAAELAGGDYARVTLTGVSVARTGTTVRFTSDPVDFGSAVTLTAKYLVIYDDSHASDALLGYVDLNTGGGSASSTSGPFEVAPDAEDGWFTMAPAA